MIPRTEGDDVIYYVTKLFKEKNKVFIASNDKDFIQLLDENVVIWNQTKKQAYTKKMFDMEYGIDISNFVRYRAVIGDTSDNIKGVRGFGEKTTKKHFSKLLK